MVNNNTKKEQSWQKIILEKLNSFDRLIERLLIQMRLRERFDKEEIINQLFINISNRVDKGGIKIEHYIDDNIIFYSRNKNGEYKKILHIDAYLRIMTTNYLNMLFQKEKTTEVSVPIEMLECLESENHTMDLYDNEKYCNIKEKLDLLSLEDQKILELFYIENLSFEEIAQHLKSYGFPPSHYPPYLENNLRKKKQRALERLRKLY